jgi:DNA-binding YbaB/EbfC family protein
VKDMQRMMKEAQKMAAEMQKAQEGLADIEVEGSAGGGAVKVTVNGGMEFQSVTIRPDAVDPDDVDMLQDLVVASVNEALRSAQELQERALGGTGGAEGFDPMSALDALGGLGGLGGGLGGLGGGMAPGGGGAPNRAARRQQRKR